jgi:hypothetical protein
MAEQALKAGKFVWRDLATDDVDGARRFYGELLGWKFEGMPGEHGTYWIASRKEGQVGGIMAKPAGMEMPSVWSSYVLVDDVDACAARAKAAGGTVIRPPADIPQVGRFAVIADPQGAVLLPFRPLPGQNQAPPTPGPGDFCWESLVTTDPKAGIAFWSKVIPFGVDKGPAGIAVFTAGDPVADISQARPGERAHWGTHVAVADVQATRDRAAALGGKVLVPGVPIPDVGTMVVIADPGGAVLGLFQGK